jgi:GABA permease
MSHQPPELKKELKIRHITMISLGGIIGAGLFIGSGSLINAAGPGSIFSYAFAGLLVILVMRMLGEMSTANPSSGSFATYAREALGPWAGYTIGWLYWFFWVIVIAVEAIAGSTIIQYWFPSLLTLTNLYSVKSFGEFEYWFSLIKVVSLVLFLLLGGAIILGLIPGVESPGASNLLHRGGFLPNGISSVFLGVAIVMFSFMGTEIVATAAGESAQPERAITIATNRYLSYFNFLSWINFNLGYHPSMGFFKLDEKSVRFNFRAGERPSSGSNYELYRTDCRFVLLKFRSIHEFSYAVLNGAKRRRAAHVFESE